MAACSKDEVIQQNPNDEITFEIAANNAVSRAADGYCNAVKPGDFDVWAKVGTTNYFAQTNYSLKDGTWKITDSNVRYWPDEAVDFFAAKNYTGAEETPATVTWSYGATAPAAALTLTDFIVEKDPSKQKDFIYAVTYGATKSASPAPLNFRHGLCEVVFKAQNLNKKIYVEVTGVKVQNVQNKGTFAFPTASTNDKFNVDEDNPQDTKFQGQQGTWTTVTSSLDSYTVTFDAVPVSQTGTKTEAASLTYKFDADKIGEVQPRYSKNALYLMEQQSTELWDGSTALKKEVEGSKVYDTTCGAYLILTCSIWNVADGSGKALNASDKADEVLLWNNKDIAVKLPALAWKHGRKYVYTFVFTADGNGGTNPDDMKPVFTPIKLDVKVDDFVDDGTVPDIEMKKP